MPKPNSQSVWKKSLAGRRRCRRESIMRSRFNNSNHSSKSLPRHPRMRNGPAYLILSPPKRTARLAFIRRKIHRTRRKFSILLERRHCLWSDYCYRRLLVVRNHFRFAMRYVKLDCKSLIRRLPLRTNTKLPACLFVSWQNIARFSSAELLLYLVCL